MNKVKLTICDMGMNGEGIAKKDGKVYFVPETLIGENIEAEIIKNNKNFNICKLTKIEKSSQNRVVPKCNYYGKCGGCQLEHIDYPSQCEYKKQKVKNTFKKICNEKVDINNLIKSVDNFEYRNKMVFSIFGNKIGMQKYGSREIVEIENCFLCSKNINQILKITKDFLPKFESNNLRYLVIRELNNKFLITLVATNNNLKNLNEYCKNLNAFDFGLYININTNYNEILGKKFIHIFGFKQIGSEENGIKFSLSAPSFFQVNNNVKTLLFEKIASVVKNTKLVVDAYSGAGLLSAIISKNTNKIISVELCKEACEDAKSLMQKNNISNVEIINDKCELALPNILKTNNLNDATIILDPPQNGCFEEVLNAVNKCNASKVIYVSCNPISLAKNYNILKEQYQIEEITLFDMFPQTTNIETLCILKHK